MYKHEKFSTIKTLCEQTTRTFHNRIVLCKDFTQKSNTRYYISDINSCSVTQNGTGDEQISMSGAPSSQVSCEMWLMNENNLTTLSAVESRKATQISLTNLVGYFIRPEVGIVDTEGNIIYTPLGIYEITEATSKSDWKTVNITAYDIMSTKLQSYTFDSAQFTSEYTKPTVANFLAFVDNQTSYITGYNVIANSTTYTNKILNKVLFDSTNSIDYVSYFNGKTLRETLAGISGIVGCNALVRADADEDENASSLCLTFFTSPESAYNITAPRDMQYQSETKIADDVDFLITSCTSSDNEEENESYTATYNNQDKGVGVTFSNEVIKHADIDLIAGKKTTETYGWANKSYMPMEFTWRSNPCIQVGDIISVETATGTYKNCYIAKQVLDICGGFKSTVTCPKGDAEVSFSSGEYVTPAELKKTTENLKKTMNEATQTISGANGGYVVHLDLNDDKKPDNIFITDVEVDETDFDGSETGGYYLKKSDDGGPNAKSVIRINSGGIGLSYNEKGDAGTSNDMFNVAITGKGIVADYLYTGIINKGYETYFDLGTGKGETPRLVTHDPQTTYSTELLSGEINFNQMTKKDDNTYTKELIGQLKPTKTYDYILTCDTQKNVATKIVYSTSDNDLYGAKITTNTKIRIIFTNGNSEQNCILRIYNTTKSAYTVYNLVPASGEDLSTVISIPKNGATDMTLSGFNNKYLIVKVIGTNYGYFNEFGYSYKFDGISICRIGKNDSNKDEVTRLIDFTAYPDSDTSNSGGYIQTYGESFTGYMHKREFPTYSTASSFIVKPGVGQFTDQKTSTATFSNTQFTKITAGLNPNYAITTVVDTGYTYPFCQIPNIDFSEYSTTGLIEIKIEMGDVILYGGTSLVLVSVNNGGVSKEITIIDADNTNYEKCTTGTTIATSITDFINSSTSSLYLAIKPPTNLIATTWQIPTNTTNLTGDFWGKNFSDAILTTSAIEYDTMKGGMDGKYPLKYISYFTDYYEISKTFNWNGADITNGMPTSITVGEYIESSSTSNTIKFAGYGLDSTGVKIGISLYTKSGNTYTACASFILATALNNNTATINPYDTTTEEWTIFHLLQNNQYCTHFRFWITCGGTGSGYWAGISSTLSTKSKIPLRVYGSGAMTADITKTKGITLTELLPSAALELRNGSDTTTVSRIDAVPFGTVNGSYGTQLKLRSRVSAFSKSTELDNSDIVLCDNTQLRLTKDGLFIYRKDTKEWVTIANFTE